MNEFEKPKKSLRSRRKDTAFRAMYLYFASGMLLVTTTMTDLKYPGATFLLIALCFISVILNLIISRLHLPLREGIGEKAMQFVLISGINSFLGILLDVFLIITFKPSGLILIDVMGYTSFLIVIFAASSALKACNNILDELEALVDLKAKMDAMDAEIDDYFIDNALSQMPEGTEEVFDPNIPDFDEEFPDGQGDEDSQGDY